MKRGFRKVGWTWTRQGWKRVPRRMLAVELVPMPKKRKTRKLRRISPASPKPETPIRAAPPKTAVGHGRADSAPTLAPKPETPVLRQMRMAYDELSGGNWKKGKSNVIRRGGTCAIRRNCTGGAIQRHRK